MDNLLNQTISTNLDGIPYYLSYLSKTFSEWSQKILNENGFNASLRWTSYLSLFISLVIIFIGIKIAKPIIKIVLVALGIILIAGLLLVPTW